MKKEPELYNKKNQYKEIICDCIFIFYQNEGGRCGYEEKGTTIKENPYTASRSCHAYGGFICDSICRGDRKCC